MPNVEKFITDVVRNIRSSNSELLKLLKSGRRKSEMNPLDLIIAWGKLYLDDSSEMNKKRIGEGILAQLIDLQNGDLKDEGYYTLHYCEEF